MNIILEWIRGNFCLDLLGKIKCLREFSPVVEEIGALWICELHYLLDVESCNREAFLDGREYATKSFLSSHREVIITELGVVIVGVQILIPETGEADLRL